VRAVLCQRWPQATRPGAAAAAGVGRHPGCRCACCGAHHAGPLCATRTALLHGRRWLPAPQRGAPRPAPPPSPPHTLSAWPCAWPVYAQACCWPPPQRLLPMAWRSRHLATALRCPARCTWPCPWRAWRCGQQVSLRRRRTRTLVLSGGSAGRRCWQRATASRCRVLGCSARPHATPRPRTPHATRARSRGRHPGQRALPRVCGRAKGAAAGRGRGHPL
jgi:hypothetical protein